MMFDITKRKSLENELNQQTKDLELLFYQSALDLKTLLSSTENILKHLKKGELTSNKNLVETCDTLVKREKLLVENMTQASLKTVSRNETSQIIFQDVINDILQLPSLKIKLKGINTVKQLDTSSEFYCNSELVHMIFYNLIHNAITYSKAPTISKIPCISISVKTCQHKAIIEISDTGIGIRKENLQKIFDLYYRVNPLDDNTGSGFGLYVVKRIVNTLKGDIQVESKLNKGSSFKITLPNLK